MSDWERMTVQRACIMIATVFLATSREAGAVVVHAAVDLGGQSGEFLQILFKHIDTLVVKEQEDDKTLSQGDSEVAMLQTTPSVTIKGNITDPARRLTLTFTVQASRSPPGSGYGEDEDYDDEEEDDEWRSSSGVLAPIVEVVEPYFLSFVELVFNGVLSTVISNFLEGTNPLGDIRLV